MTRHPGRLAGAALALLAQAAAACAQEPAPSPSPSPAATLREAAERAAEEIVAAANDPCRDAKREGVPCFPALVEAHGPTYSVRQSLQELFPDSMPSPDRPPTLAELAPYRPGPVRTVIPLVTFDPVCVGKSALKKLRGKNDTYYLYRTRDAHGVKVGLYDQKIDAAHFQGEAELLGRFDGECEAIAAYRAELRRLTPAATPSEAKGP